MGSNPSKKIPLLGIAYPVKGKTISGTEDAPGMGRIRGLKGEEMTICGLIMYFVKIWAKDPVLDNLYSKQIVIEPFLYKIYISCCMDVWALLGRFTHV